MVLRKRVAKKRVYPKKRSYKKRGPMKFIPKPQRIEQKYINVDMSAGTIDSGTPYNVLMNGLAQGTNNQSRIGNKITIKQIELNMMLKTGSSSTTCSIKCQVVYDKQPNGAVFNIGDLLNTVGGVYAPWATRNSINGQRFVVLKSFYVTLNLNAAGVPVEKLLRKYIKCNIPTQYGGNAGTIADITTGSLYLLFTSDQASTSSPSATGTIRLRFTDD